MRPCSWHCPIRLSRTWCLHHERPICRPSVLGSSLPNPPLSDLSRCLFRLYVMLLGHSKTETVFSRLISLFGLLSLHRHGDLLNRYLYLTGRVDMRSIEVRTPHHLDLQPLARIRPHSAEPKEASFGDGELILCSTCHAVTGDHPPPHHQRLRPQGQEGPLQGPRLHLLPGTQITLSTVSLTFRQPCLSIG